MNNLIVVVYALSTVALLILAFGSLYAGLKMKSVVVKTSLILVSVLLLITVILGTVGFVYYKNRGEPVQTSSSTTNVVYKYLQPNRYVNYWDIYDDNGWWWDRNPRRHTTTNVNIHNHNKPARSTTTTTTTTTTKFIPAPTLSPTTTTKPALLQIAEPSSAPELGGVLPAPLVNIPPSQIPMPSGMITAEQLMANSLRNASVSPPTVQSSLPFPPALPDGTPNITVNP